MDHFITELSSFFKWLIGSTMHVSVLICLILAIKALIRHRLAVRWHYWLWLLLLVRMVMPWAPQSSFSVFTLLSQAKTSIVSKPLAQATRSAPVIDLTAKPTQDLAPPATLPSEAEPQASLAPTASRTAQTSANMRSLELIGILSLLWLVVALALAIAALACNFKLWRIIRSQRPLTEGKILDALEDCKAEMGIQTILGVIVTDKVKSPALFGVVRPRLLLPEGIIETLTQEELRYVFLHELAHLKRRDIYLGWLMVILQVLHWFNPLVWLAFHRMRADRELACDGLVLSRMHAGESERYGTTIVNLLRGFPQVQYVPGIAGILEDKSQLKRRITMIARFKKGSYRWSTLAVVLLAVLGCVVLTNAQGVLQTEKKEPEVMAKEFVELLVKGQFSKAVESFDVTMKKSLPTDKLAQTWRTTTGQAGLFKQQLGTRLEKFLGSEIVFVTCEFEKGPMDVKVVYDSDNKVTGLWFVPTPQKVLEEYRGKAKEKPQVTRRVMRTVKLSYDDGSSEGRNSIAGGGHAVLFEAPAEGSILKSVRIYGSRYGYDVPPRENFHIWLCDKDFQVIKDFAFPYSRFVKGNAKWVTLRVEPTPVPESFIICAGFNPERTKGVYVHYDESVSGNSFFALPGQKSRVFNQGEWMIQAILSAPAARAEIEPAGLVGYWKFDGNAEDSAGNNNGIVYGAQWVTGRIGNTLRFDGIDDYVRVDNNSSMNFGASADFSVGFWIKASIQDSAVISKGPEIPPHGWTGWSPGWNIQLENTVIHKAGVRFDMYDGNNGGYGIVTTGVDALDNSWHHVFITVDRDGYAKAYLDASEKDSRDVSSIGDINNSRELLIGWRGDWLYFDGLIDEIAIYNRVLSAEEIGAIYQSGLPDIVDLEIIGPNEVAPTVAPGQPTPVVVETTPEAFTNNVSPTLTSISVTFDRPMMDGSWSWTGGGDTYPKMAGRPYYDQSKRTCTMPVTLEPGKVYWVGINSPSHRNFKTPSRQAAPWYIILFATRSADGKPTPIPEKMLARAKRINAAAGKPAPATLLPKTTPDGKLVIPSQRPWTDTGIDVRSGDELRLLAAGTIHGCHGPKEDWAYGPWSPDGKLFEEGHYAAGGQRLFALIGRIGDREFHVGSKATITAPADGRLYLGVSDSYHSDNVGAFTVKVEVSPATQPRTTD